MAARLPTARHYHQLPGKFSSFFCSKHDIRLTLPEIRKKRCLIKSCLKLNPVDPEKRRLKPCNHCGNARAINPLNPRKCDSCLRWKDYIKSLEEFQ